MPQEPEIPDPYVYSFLEKPSPDTRNRLIAYVNGLSMEAIVKESFHYGGLRAWIRSLVLEGSIADYAAYRAHLLDSQKIMVLQQRGRDQLH